MNIFGQRFFVGSILLQFTIILIVENCVKSVIFSLKNEKRKRDDGRYPPFVVSLQLFTGNESNSKHMCLATIIHKRVVLTAAHCFVAHRDAAHWFIVTPTRGKGLCYPVETIWAHAAFQHLDGNDIALVVIKDHFQFGMNETDEDALSKIDYRDPNHRESMERAYFIGWPKEFVNDRSQSSADTLIPFHTIDTFRCIEEYRFIYLTDGELCAMAAPRKAALNGESGGPLINRQLSLQWAILSYGRTRNNRQAGGGAVFVFTRLNLYVQWIDNKLANFN